MRCILLQETGTGPAVCVHQGDGGGWNGHHRHMRRPRLEIEYCAQCRWLLRAAWMAQELLVTFESELGEVVLIPGIGGVFDVRVDGETIWHASPLAHFRISPRSSALPATGLLQVAVSVILSAASGRTPSDDTIVAEPLRVEALGQLKGCLRAG
jgi:selT/selW/selH-like putative selenoprotein